MLHPPATTLARLLPRKQAPDLGTNEVAALLGCTRQTIARYTRTGRLPVVRHTLGGRRRYDRALVEGLARKLRGEDASAAA